MERPSREAAPHVLPHAGERLIVGKPRVGLERHGSLPEAVVPPAHALSFAGHPARVEPPRGHLEAPRAFDHRGRARQHGRRPEGAAHALRLTHLALVLPHRTLPALAARHARQQVVEARGRFAPWGAEGVALVRGGSGGPDGARARGAGDAGRVGPPAEAGVVAVDGAVTARVVPIEGLLPGGAEGAHVEGESRDGRGDGAWVRGHHGHNRRARDLHGLSRIDRPGRVGWIERLLR
mmetsp:Transcript_2562/g.6116  ORF Transcript_2562/g.6116 Transcript_2562/m.6116 type:complete len:236 (-) Transcript_2562:861-1568(-)